MAVDRVDQQFIADSLGVSRTSVTKVLNHDPLFRVSPETRERIVDKAREMNYRPRRRRTMNMAFVVCERLSSSEQELHLAICEEASKLQYRVFLVKKDVMPSYRELSLSVNPLSADGVILTGFCGADVLTQLGEVLPVVAVGQCHEVINIDWVRADTQVLAQALTDQLIANNHEHIAVIVNSANDIFSRHGIDGYRRACEIAGLQPDSSLIWEKKGKLYPAILKDVLNRKPKPTALLAFTTDDHAIILSTLNALGCRVPQDLSYVGWAIPNTTSLLPFPVITSLDSLFQSVARTAVRRLLDRVENGYLPPEDIVVPVAIRRGETCIGSGSSPQPPVDASLLSR